MNPEWTGYNSPKQNAHVERVIGTFKANWLWFQEGDTFTEAKDLVIKAIEEYNEEHHHWERWGRFFEGGHGGPPHRVKVAELSLAGDWVPRCNLGTSLANGGRRFGFAALRVLSRPTEKAFSYQRVSLRAEEGNEVKLVDIHQAPVGQFQGRDHRQGQK